MIREANKNDLKEILELYLRITLYTATYPHPALATVVLLTPNVQDEP